jgi:hypothetical protein
VCGHEVRQRRPPNTYPNPPAACKLGLFAPPRSPHAAHRSPLPRCLPSPATPEDWRHTRQWERDWRSGHTPVQGLGSRKRHAAQCRHNLMSPPPLPHSHAAAGVYAAWSVCVGVSAHVRGNVGNRCPGSGKYEKQAGPAEETSALPLAHPRSTTPICASRSIHAPECVHLA